MFFPSEPTGVFVFFIGCLVQKLSAKQTLGHCEDTFTDCFSPITFKLDAGKNPEYTIIFSGTLYI